VILRMSRRVAGELYVPAPAGDATRDSTDHHRAIHRRPVALRSAMRCRELASWRRNGRASMRFGPQPGIHLAAIRADSNPPCGGAIPPEHPAGWRRIPHLVRTMLIIADCAAIGSLQVSRGSARKASEKAAIEAQERDEERKETAERETERQSWLRPKAERARREAERRRWRQGQCEPPLWHWKRLRSSLARRADELRRAR